jgi:hypothetical protein
MLNKIQYYAILLNYGLMILLSLLISFLTHRRGTSYSRLIQALASLALTRS